MVPTATSPSPTALSIGGHHSRSGRERPGHLGGGRGGSVLLRRCSSRLGLLTRDVDVILLARAVDRDLDRNLTALDLLSVHFVDGLLLELLRGKGDEAEPTALAALVAGLQLLDHKARNGAQGDLGGGRLVVGEDLLELLGVSKPDTPN